MKNIFLILFLFVVQAGISQSMVVWVDYHDPVKGKGGELREAVADKTKKYNQGPGTFQLYTFEVISGGDKVNLQELVLVQLGLILIIILLHQKSLIIG